MINDEEYGPIICYNCDEEFVIHTPYQTEAIVSFCPFCDSEVEDIDEEVDDDLFDNDLK